MRKGFTLAEVLLGMVILAFTLVAGLALFANCIILNESSRNLTIAVSHAQFVMEEIKNTNFSSIESGVWDWDSRDDLTPLTNESITTTITETTWLDIVVQVKWEDRRGRIMNNGEGISLKTLIVEP